MRIHRYTQWDGTQQVLFPTTDDLLKHLSDHLLEEEGVRRALRDLMRRGFTSEDGQRSVKGMRDFLREADEKRREWEERHHEWRDAGDRRRPDEWHRGGDGRGRDWHQDH